MAAIKGHIEAAYRLGLMYRNGKGVRKSFTEAFKYFQQAVLGDFALAKLELAICFQEGLGTQKCLEGAFHWFGEAANDGINRANYHLALCYEHGIGTSKDAALALEKMRLAAKPVDNFFDAQLAYARYHLTGNLVGKRESLAVELLKTLIQNDKNKICAAARRTLGLCYLHGRGIEVDPREALALFTQARDAGDSEAYRLIAMCYREGYGVAEDRKLAVENLEKGVVAQDPICHHRMGCLFLMGCGVAQDKKLAVEQFRLGIEKKDPECFNALGVCYLLGYGVGRNYRQAIEYFRAAVKKDLSQAKNNLAWCMLQGWEVDRDVLGAINLLKSAAFSDGSQTAIHNLAWCRLNGFDGEADLRIAQQLFSKSYDKSLVLTDNPKQPGGLGVSFCREWPSIVCFSPEYRWHPRKSADSRKLVYNLGLCSFMGWQVKQDLNKAKFLLRLARRCCQDQTLLSSFEDYAAVSAKLKSEVTEVTVEVPPKEKLEPGLEPKSRKENAAKGDVTNVIIRVSESMPTAAAISVTDQDASKRVRFI